MAVKRLTVAALVLGFRMMGAEPPKPLPEPRILSVYPSVVRAGSTSTLTVRGQSLSGAHALMFQKDAVAARVLDVAQEPSKKEGDPAIDLVRVEVIVSAEATDSRFRLIAAQGATNEWPLRVVSDAITEEASLPKSFAHFPIVVAGKLAERGEVDTIWIEAKAGETLTLTAASPTPAFDPSLALFEPSGSWFEEGRLNRIAFNDEPLHFPGLSPDARLVHQFEKGGRYAVQVRAFSGQGGPDFTYHLRIASGAGEPPLLQPRLISAWDERQFTRKITADWMTKIAERGGRAEGVKLATFGASTGDSAEPPVMTVPGVVVGRIGKPAETHRIRLRIDSPQDLAIEVEAPEATLPRFNPVVRLMAPDGGEVVTNVYTKRNNNGLYMMKMIQAKATFTLRSGGEYLLEIRDITTDVAADDFAYRVLVRPQIPHVGRIDIAEDRVNLEPGQSKALTVTMEREESFTGLVLVSAEGLPTGVTATAGMANPIDKPPLPNGGRLERYVGKPQTATVMLMAADDAAVSEMPSMVRVLLRTVTNGRSNPAILVKEVPVMVVRRRPS